MDHQELLRRIAELENLESEHKQAIGILQKKEKKFKVLIENLPQKIYHKDINSVYVSCNNNYVRDLKIKPDEITGKTDFDLYKRELAEKYIADDKRILESGKTEYLKEKYIQNGQEVFLRSVKTPIKDENGNSIGIFGIIWDTQLWPIEDSLNESEDRYRSIIENSNDMIWIVDTEGRYQYVNKRIEEFSGLKRDYFLGKSWIPFIDKRDLPKVIDCFYKALNGKPQQYEVSVFKEDGTNFFLLVNKAPFYSNGEIIGTVSFGRDITELKKAEEKIKESLQQKINKYNKQNRLMNYLIEGTRGGKTRSLILSHLSEKSYNANQLATILNMDYKTIRHHLKLLVKYGIISINHVGRSELYLISKNIAESLNTFENVNKNPIRNNRVKD